MNYAYAIKNLNIDLQYQDSFPDTNYVRWAELPKADAYVVHSFHDSDIPTLLPFLQELQIPICVIPDFHEDFFWIGMTYGDFEKLYEASETSFNYAYCDPYDKEYELMYDGRMIDGELISTGRNYYGIGNYQSTEEGCTGCDKVILGNRKRAFCPNCGEDVYMS